MTNIDRNAAIADAVAAGLSYSQAAAKFGVTRGVVAGVCSRRRWNKRVCHKMSAYFERNPDAMMRRVRAMNEARAAARAA